MVLFVRLFVCTMITTIYCCVGDDVDTDVDDRERGAVVSNVQRALDVLASFDLEREAK